MTRILLIKTSSMGDVIHSLPVATDIHRYIPDVQIDWVVEEAFADIPAMHLGVGRVISVATRRWRGGLMTARVWREMRGFKRRLQGESYDMVLDSQGLFKSALIAWLARGPVYGFDRRSAREPLASCFYDVGFEIAQDKHAVERNRELAARACQHPAPDAPPDYGIGTPVAATAAGDEAASVAGGRGYIVFLHGTSRPSKLWPEKNWIALASNLIEEGITPLMTWGNREEQHRADTIARTLHNSVVVLPKMTLECVATVFRNALAVVGVDTGLVHLATALGRPTVAVYTDTDPKRTGVLAADVERAINLGGKGLMPSPEDVRRALAVMGVLEN